MSDTKFSAQEFFANNPLPATPNPLVNQTLALLRMWFWQLWLIDTSKAMLDCIVALDGCAKPKRGAVFTREWESWLKALMDRVDVFFDLLFITGKANVDCALPDPATWACDSLQRLILENLVCWNGRDHVVDNWIKLACGRRPVSIWQVPVWAGFYGVSASNEQIRDSDLIIPVLRQNFEQTMFNHLFQLRGVAMVQLTQVGWLPAREDSPIVTLEDLKGLAPRDPRLKNMIRAIFPGLKQEILDLRSAKRREGVSIETIRQTFFLLRDIDQGLIREWALKDAKEISEATAAKEIIQAYAGNVSPETVDRYTRCYSDASHVTAQADSDPENIPDHQAFLVRLLAPELLPRYEKSRVA